MFSVVCWDNVCVTTCCKFLVRKGQQPVVSCCSVNGCVRRAKSLHLRQDHNKVSSGVSEMLVCVMRSLCVSLVFTGM